jgi:hypothetical protein
LLVAALRLLQVTSRWPAELDSRQRRLAAVQDTLNNGINTEVTELHTRLHHVARQTAEHVALHVRHSLRGSVCGVASCISDEVPTQLQCNQFLISMLLAPNPQADLQRLLSQEAALKQQISAMQERQAAAERARAGDRAFLQVRQQQQQQLAACCDA